MIGALLGLLRPLLPFFLVAGAGSLLGGVSAWQIQGVRIDNARNEFHAYKLDQEQLRLTAERDAAAQREKAAAQREKAAALYNTQAKELAHEIESGAVYRRCVAAGKCVRVPNVSACATGIRLPSVSGEHADGGGSVPVAGEPAEEMTPVVGDCARVQLRLNRIQAEIEEQPGFNQ